jgi:hypothetical protein
MNTNEDVQEYSLLNSFILGMTPEIFFLAFAIYAGIWVTSVAGLLWYVIAAMTGIGSGIAYYIFLSKRISPSGTVTAPRGGVMREIALLISIVLGSGLMATQPLIIIFCFVIYGIFFFSTLIILVGRLQRRVGKRILVTVGRKESRRRLILVAIAFAIAMIVFTKIRHAAAPALFKNGLEIMKMAERRK